MKSQIVILVVGLALVCVESRPQAQKEESKILSYNNEVRENGYSFSFQTNDPIRRSEEGKIVPAAAQAQGRSLDGGEESNSNLQVNGDFGFNFPDGISFQTIFQADENGYRPKVSFGSQSSAGGQQKPFN